MANGRTGQVFIEDFDIGLAETLGSEKVRIELDGEEAEVYALRVPGVTGPRKYSGLVPVIMSDPESAFAPNLLPQIIVSRGSIDPDMIRWQPGGREYMIPAPSAKEVTQTSTGRKGPSLVEIKAWAWPFNINYDVHVRGVTRLQADRMLRVVGRVLWAYGSIRVRDSEGDLREYHAFAEGIQNLSEIADVTDRTMGHTIPVRVEAELDFLDPILAPTTLNLGIQVGPLRVVR